MAFYCEKHKTTRLNASSLDIFTMEPRERQKVERKWQFLIQSGSEISRVKDAQHAASYEENKLICEYLLPP